MCSDPQAAWGSSLSTILSWGLPPAPDHEPLKDRAGVTRLCPLQDLLVPKHGLPGVLLHEHTPPQELLLLEPPGAQWGSPSLFTLHSALPLTRAVTKPSPRPLSSLVPSPLPPPDCSSSLHTPVRPCGLQGKGNASASLFSTSQQLREGILLHHQQMRKLRSGAEPSLLGVIHHDGSRARD